VTAVIWLFFLVPLVLALAVQGLVRSVFRRYRAIPNHAGVTGADAARALLDAHWLQRVQVEIITGFLTDHYDGEARRYACPSRSGVSAAWHRSE
jgi:Zn-dependent membrane protease YugP